MEDIIGNIYKSNSSGKFEVVDFIERRKWNSYYKIRFINTGTEKISSRKCILLGNVKDEYFKGIYGVACIGAKDSYINNKRAYHVWHSMIRRCYSDDLTGSYRAYGKVGVRVCDNWLCFENFVKDLELIEGYDEIKFNNKELSLDKDIKSKDTYVENKVYSLENCMFVEKGINSKLQINKNQKDIIIEYDNKVYLFDSIREASRILNFDSGNISRVLTGKRRNTYKDSKIFYKDYYNLTNVHFIDCRLFK